MGEGGNEDYGGGGYSECPFFYLKVKFHNGPLAPLGFTRTMIIFPVFCIFPPPPPIFELPPTPITCRKILQAM